MFEKFKRRSYQLEHIDTGSYTSDEYEGCIVELQRVNRWMGDAWSLEKTLFKQVEDEEIDQFSILDVGAGSGELLRVTAAWCLKTKRQLRAVGVELNERSSVAIREASQAFPEISAVRGDALHLPFDDGEFDYVICSLFTHHFHDLQVREILLEMSRVARKRIFVIDLHRHPLAYFLYTTLGKVVLKNRLLREDGALSILRSFTPDELFQNPLDANLSDVRIERHFPFRLVLSASGKGKSQSEETRMSEQAERAA
jgi:ubiquinone/menaquinone biosynthesis C-methylase UbiE